MTLDMEPRPSRTSHGVKYGSYVGFADRIDGLPSGSGATHARVSLRELDPDLLAAIERSDPHDVTVEIATLDGDAYTLHHCEAVALSMRTSSVELAVGAVTVVRAAR